MRSLFLIPFLVAATSLLAQADAELHIARTLDIIKIDGVLDEKTWQHADLAADFTPNFPIDTGRANARSEMRLAFDDTYLYVSAICWQARQDYTVQSLKRDFPPGSGDVINVLFSPFKDGLNGIMFAVSPMNVQRECLVDNGTNSAYEWDNKWYSAVTNDDDKWMVEMAIPFKTLRYKVAEGQNSWGIQFIRTRLKNWETSTWTPVPRQYHPVNLNYTYPLIWDTPPPKNKIGYSLIPFVSGQYNKNYERDPQTLALTAAPDQWKGSVGGDVKIGITPSLNLDLTINPDFSQVEVDQQVANLSRFELFFPERRQFFLENRDLFATFGFPSTRPFFSRRIGLAYNPVTGQNQRVPILAGARLSGKLNDDWRIGLLNMHTRQVNFDENNALPAANFSVATLQRKVLQRSAVSFIYADKENLLNKLEPGQRAGFQPWNRVAGGEFNLYSKDNRWEAESYYHRSFSPDPDKRGASMAQFVGYEDRYFNARMGIMRTDTTYTADMGFVPRPGVQSMFPGIGVNWYPKSKKINSVKFFAESDVTTDLHFKPTDNELSSGISVSFTDQSEATFGIYSSYTFLFDSLFDPSNLYREGTKPLPRGGYRYTGLTGSVFTSSSYNFQAILDWGAGQFFNGTGALVNGEFKYRLQPWGSLAIAYSYTHIRLPKPYASADLWLIGPRAELSFSRSVFASAFFQYNTQANNFNINARLQWRFAPVSDLFLVYTDNSYAQPITDTAARFLTPKNKSVVMKLVYWL
jgi:Domain of unknown function (DUF5916)